MADGSITGLQGDKIISLLEKILSELKSSNQSFDQMKNDTSDMQLRVKWIEDKVSKLD